MPAHPETEIKLRVPDLPAIIAQLHKLGATCHGRVLEQNTLFDTPTHDIRRLSRLLRLRIETPARSPFVPAGAARAWLTSKRPAPSSAAARYKQNLESESSVSPRTDWLARFRAIGLAPGFRYEKFRTTFRLGPLHLDLDETPVGDFLELEGPPPQIDRAARALGYTPADYIRATYWDLYAAHARRRAKIPRHMLFPA
jgi:adenylate cyclase class 2